MYLVLAPEAQGVVRSRELPATPAYSSAPKNPVHSIVMTIKVSSAEQQAARWAEGEARAVREAVERPTNKAQYDWGLGFGSLYIRKLTRVRGGRKMISLPRSLLRQLGLENCERVIVIPHPESGGYIRPATPEEVEAAHRLLTDCPPPIFAEPESDAEPKCFDKKCRDCGRAFLTRAARRVYCDVCRRARTLTTKRDYNHRKGKLAPSYQRRLKRRALPQSESAPVPK